MNIYVKFPSLGSNLGPSFSVSADIGSVTPNSVTRSELLTGKVFNFSQATASSIIISSIGSCSTSQSFNIDKDQTGCYSNSAENYQEGNLRPTDDTGGIAPFQQETLDNAEIQDLFYHDIGGEFILNILGRTFNIYPTHGSGTNPDGSRIEIGDVTGPSPLGNGTFDALYPSSEDIEMEIYFDDAGVAYTITGNINSGITVKEWLISDIVLIDVLSE